MYTKTDYRNPKIIRSKFKLKSPKRPKRAGTKVLLALKEVLENMKTEIYPKTPRMKELGDRILVTEKLDGSNLVFFKYEDVLYVAQRSNILPLELAKVESTYPGLKSFLEEYGEQLQAELCEGSAICGEWLGMGQLKYNYEKRWHMFAKANVTKVEGKFKLYNIRYDHSLFIYPFSSQEIPAFLDVVPIVAELEVLPNKEVMDELYDKYCGIVNRPVEGFVASYGEAVQKYVRMKRGKVVEYSETDRKGK